MRIYGAGSKCLGRTEKETERLCSLRAIAPGNSHCAPTAWGFKLFTLDHRQRKHISNYASLTQTRHYLFHRYGTLGRQVGASACGYRASQVRRIENPPHQGAAACPSDSKLPEG